jgi:hypothetical protein
MEASVALRAESKVEGRFGLRLRLRRRWLITCGLRGRLQPGQLKGAYQAGLVVKEHTHDHLVHWPKFAVLVIGALEVRPGRL